jgi:hypothetical protein
MRINLHHTYKLFVLHAPLHHAEGWIKNTASHMQVVFVGAGFDARGLRGKDMRFSEVPEEPKDAKRTMFEVPPPITFYEVDLPELIEAKREILATVEETDDEDDKEARDENLPVVVRIGVDVMHDDWLLALRMAGFNAQRPACFVLEGFLYYFDEASVNRTLEAITSYTVGGSRIAMSGVSRSATVGGGSKGKFVWGTDQPEEFIESFGWEGADAYQFGDPTIAFGYPMEQEVIDNWMKPRTDLQAKRTWYIIATRQHPPKTRLERIQESIGACFPSLACAYFAACVFGLRGNRCFDFVSLVNLLHLMIMMNLVKAVISDTEDTYIVMLGPKTLFIVHRKHVLGYSDKCWHLKQCS